MALAILHKVGYWELWICSLQNKKDFNNKTRQEYVLLKGCMRMPLSLGWKQAILHGHQCNIQDPMPEFASPKGFYIQLLAAIGRQHI